MIKLLLFAEPSIEVDGMCGHSLTLRVSVRQYIICLRHKLYMYFMNTNGK